MRGVKMVIRGALVQEVDRALIVMVFLSLKAMKAENVMMKYISRLRSVKVGLNCRIRTIQPRWAIDE